MRKLEFTNKQQEQLFNDNIGFAFTLSKDWNNKCALDKTDLDSFALEALVTAAIKYNEEKNDSFKCFARMIINQKMQREVKAYLADKRSINNNAIIGLDINDNDAYNNIEECTSYNVLMSLIERSFTEVDERMAKATRMYILEGYTQKEIAEEMGVAIMTVSQWISKTKEVIATRLKMQGIVTERFFKKR